MVVDDELDRAELLPHLHRLEGRILERVGVARHGVSFRVVRIPAVSPPSTTIVAPLTNDARSDTSQATASAISPARPSRPTGMPRSTSVAQLVVPRHAGHHARRDLSRADDVEPHDVPELERQRLGEGDQRGLRGGVQREALLADVAGHRRDGRDRPAGGDQPVQREPRHLVDGAAVDREDGVPVGDVAVAERHPLRLSGGVDERGDLPLAALQRRRDERRQVVAAGDVGGHVQRAGHGPLDLGAGLSVAAGEHHREAVLGQPLDARPADAVRAARDDRGARRGHRARRDAVAHHGRRVAEPHRRDQRRNRLAVRADHLDQPVADLQARRR